MIRADRELLAELARLNGDMAQLGMRIMENAARAAEQVHYAQRLIVAGERLKARAEGREGVVIEGEVCAEKFIALPGHTGQPVELDWRP